MSTFPFVVGDFVKLPDWKDDQAIRITAIGEDRFIAFAPHANEERFYRISSAWLKVEPVNPLPERWIAIDRLDGETQAFESAAEALDYFMELDVYRIWSDADGTLHIERVPS